MRIKKPFPVIGVSDYTIFPITEADDGTITYTSAVKLPGTVQVSPTDAGGSDTFDADNDAYDVEAYIENIGHELTNADIPAETEAMLRGITRTNGVIDIDEASLLAPRLFGVSWKLLKSDKNYRYVQYYKGKYSFASNVGGKTKPSSGASEKQTATATFIAEKRDSDGGYYRFADTDGLTAAEIAKLDESFLGAAFPVGFESVTPSAGINADMGVYSWTNKNQTLTANLTGAGIVTVSFDMQCLKLVTRTTEFQLTAASGGNIVQFRSCFYQSDGDYYLVKIGDTEITTTAAEVNKAIVTGTDGTAPYTHFTVIADTVKGDVTVKVSNDVNGSVSEWKGTYTPAAVAKLTVTSNHETRCIRVKRLRCSTRDAVEAARIAAPASVRQRETDEATDKATKPLQVIARGVAEVGATPKVTYEAVKAADATVKVANAENDAAAEVAETGKAAGKKAGKSEK